MKKIYKLTLGAGAVATAAIPAIAVVSCGSTSSKKQETNTNTESKGTTGTHTSTVATHDIHHVALSSVQIDKEFATAKSDLLKRFIELKIADASTTDADFDKNFGDYAVKLLKVIATDENALSATDTANLIDVIISKYSKDISADILPEVVKLVPVIAKYISENHLLKGALDALGFDKDSEDSDLLEKLDSNNLNLVKAALFVAKAVQSVPKDLTADTAESVITMIQTLGLPAMVSGLFPNTQEAMAAWAGLLNSGIIQQVGQLIEAIFTKGIGNIDFDEVKKDLESLIDNAIKTMNDGRVSVAGMTGNNIKGLVDNLHIPALIDILKGIVTEGVFGIDTKITDEIKAVYDSHILTLLGQLLPMDQYTQLINTFTGIINTVVNPNGGITSLSEANFDTTLKTIMGLIPGASLSDDIKGLITKVLYHGFATQEELDSYIKTNIPDSIMKAGFSQDIPVVGKVDVVVGQVLNDILHALYNGESYNPGGVMTFIAISKEISQGISPLLHKGLFVLTKDEMANVILKLKEYVSGGISRLLGLLSTPLASKALPEEAKPILDMVSKIVSALSSLNDQTITTTTAGLYDLLHSGIASAADEFRTAVPQIFEVLKAAKISIPSYIEPLVNIAVNGFDALTISQANILADWILTLIPKDTPVVSSDEFKHVILTALVGQNKIDLVKEVQVQVDSIASHPDTISASVDSSVDKANTKVKDLDLSKVIIAPQSHVTFTAKSVVADADASVALVTVEVGSDLHDVVAKTIVVKISGFEAPKVTYTSLIQNLIDKGIVKITSSNYKSARTELTKYLVSLGVPEAQAKTFEAIIQPMSAGMIPHDVDLHTILSASHLTFDEWYNSIRGLFGTTKDAARAFATAMDALNA